MKYFSFPQATQSMQSINPLINISQNPIQHQSFHDLLVAPIPHSSVQTIDTGLIQEEEKINQMLYKSNPKFFNSSMSFVDYAIEIDPIQLRPNPLISNQFNQFQQNNNPSNNNIQNLNKSIEEGLKVNIRNASYSSINLFNNSFDNKINNVGEDFSLQNQSNITEDIKKEILSESNMNILNNKNNNTTNNNNQLMNNNHSLLPNYSADIGSISNFEFKKTEQRKNLLGMYNQLKKEQNKS
jgi:hypothetical protein